MALYAMNAINAAKPTTVAYTTIVVAAGRITATDAAAATYPKASKAHAVTAVKHATPAAKTAEFPQKLMKEGMKSPRLCTNAIGKHINTPFVIDSRHI
jgi:hypothetical protein